MIRINLWLGKYRILSILNASSLQSNVFLAENIKIQESCIIKRIKKDSPFFPKVKREIVFLKELKSEFLPRLYDVEEDEAYLYLIEEYLEGFHPTALNLEKNKLTERRLMQLIGDLFEFLKLLHENQSPVLYLDWKPENIIVTEKGIKVIDFGSAFYLNEKEEIKLATDSYSAEELKKGEKVGTYTDIFGFGCLLKLFSDYTLKSKKRWFQKGVRKRMLELSEQCMKNSPEKRCSLRYIEKEVISAKKEVFKMQDESFLGGDLFSYEKERVIGICTAFRGAGGSHVAVLIAKKLAGESKKVAFVDFTKGGNPFEFLKEVENLSGNIEVFSNVDTEKMVGILGERFQHIIIDFGIFREGIFSEYLRCDKKILILQNSFAKKAYVEEFLQRNQSFFKKKNLYVLLNMSKKEDVDKFKKGMKEKKINISVGWQEFEPIKNK